MGNKIVTREGFVSDRLLDLGKRLQVNYDIKEGGGELSDTPPPSEKLSARRVVAERSEAERMHRELADRFANAAAATEAELELIAVPKAELERFRAFLDEASGELEQVDLGSPTAIQDIEALRFRYFTASGRAQSFFGSSRGGGSAAPTPDFEERSFGTVLFESMPVVLAILIGAAVVGSAIVFALY